MDISSQPIQSEQPILVFVDKPVVKKGRKLKIVPDLQNFNAILKTYHFNPSATLVEQLTYFASVHRFDERKVFKESWKKWIDEQEIAPLIQEEIQRLTSAGYTGDALQKIFKSVRYYYKKKPSTVDNDGNEIKKEHKQRKTYEGFDSKTLETMDTFIAYQIKSHIVNVVQDKDGNAVPVCQISPANAFTHYCETNKLELDTIDKAELAKYKKTFKNRFFCIRTKIQDIETSQITGKSM
jgi:hypothetical protein